MTEGQAVEKPRSRRMVVWLVVAPAVIVLLAVLGANWKAFHLAYCRHLLRSEGQDERERGIRLMAAE